MTMKKKILSAAVLAALGVGTAQAVNISTNGLGQVMVAPYYTVQGDEETLLSIVNTTAETKAVKVRFREAYNSREVLDFNLYLSPHDVWVAKVQDSADGEGAAIVTNDNSCTVPSVQGAGADGVPFRTFLFDGSYSSPADRALDGGPTDLSRTKEGYFEIIEMGVADESNSVWDGNTNGWTDSTHEADGVPDYCAGLRANWAPGGAWKTNSLEGLTPPTGGLFATAALINVQTGTEIGEPMTVLEDFSNIVMHTDPGDLAPSLGQVNPPTSVAIINDPNASNIATFYVDNWANAIDAVSAVMMAERVINEYTVNPNTEAETDWVVTFPTKWAYADTTSADPFTSRFSYFPLTDPEGNVVGGSACETLVKVYFDREEQFVEGDIDFSPLPPGGLFELCYEANVVTFGGSNTLSAENTVKNFSLADGYTSGWASIGMYDPSAPTEHVMNAVSGNVYQGLPVIGFKATKLGNSNVGVGAAYAVSEPHKYARVVSGSGTAAY